jgi:polysaccharide chain length determinant protein (PEP-CTERM system associated)
VQQQIEAARLELSAAEQTRDAYQRELKGEQPVFVPEGPGTPRTIEGTPEIDARLAALRNALDELLRKYTEQHPDVVATTRRIQQLEEEKKVELEAQRKLAAKQGPVEQLNAERNPVFQQLRMSLAEAEARVAAARSKVAGYEAQHRQLRAQAQLVPQIEAEYTQLNRDYDVQKKTYETLLARRESAGLGIDVQDRSGAQFRVIDPPRVGQTPVAPNRLSMLGIAFAVALLSGLVASFVASQLKPTFADAHALREVTQRPVLGMVSLVMGGALARSRRRGAALFAGGLGALLAAFAGVFAFALLVTRAA